MAKVAPPPETSSLQPTPPDPPDRDVRASRPYLFSRGPILSLARRGFSIAALVALDVAGLALGIYTALVVRELVTGDGAVLWGLLWREGPAEWLKFAAPITVLVFAQAGLYRQRERRPGFGRILACLIVVALVVLAFGLGTSYDFSTSGLIPTSVLVSAVTIGALRAAYESTTLELMRGMGVRRRIVLVGQGDSLVRLRSSLAAARSGLAYEFVGVVAPTEVPGLALLGSRSELPLVLEQIRPDELILSEADFDERAVLEIVEQAHRQGVKVRLAPDTTELLVQRGEYVPGQGAPLFELRPPVLTGWDWLLKRGFDLVVSAVVLVAGLPLWVAIAAAIKLDTRGPVFFLDRRIGVGEQEFGMLKFRTMVVNADALGGSSTPQDDPRITPVGRRLRAAKLDELPQLWNVLVGDMSFVGPRPQVQWAVDLYSPEERLVLSVRPGITDSASLRFANEGEILSGASDPDKEYMEKIHPEKMRLSLEYVRSRSFGRDISIIGQTIGAVFRSAGN